MAVIETRGRRYRARVRIKGFPPQSAAFERLTDARRWAQHTEAAIREGRRFETSEARKHTAAELIDRYLRDVIPQKKLNSRGTQKAQLLWWKGQIGAYLLSNITPALLVDCKDRLAFIDKERNTLRSPSTVVRYLAVMSHAFTMAVREWGWMHENPMRRVTKPKEPRGRVRFLSDEERARLLEASRTVECPYLYTIVVVALSAGMRHGEIMNLRWSDVDLMKGRIILQDTKNGDRRNVPLTGHALEQIENLSKLRRIDTTYLFPNTNHGEKARPYEIRKSWNTALKKAEIDNFRFHDLRHSTASYLAMNGASLSEIAEVLGHKTLQMVKRYAHLSEAHTAKVVRALNDTLFGASRPGAQAK
jgi:integrase